jgi:hypothetical protein
MNLGYAVAQMSCIIDAKWCTLMAYNQRSNWCSSACMFFMNLFRQNSWILYNTAALLIRIVTFWFHLLLQFLNISTYIDLKKGLQMSPKIRDGGVGSGDLVDTLRSIQVFENCSVVSHVQRKHKLLWYRILSNSVYIKQFWKLEIYHYL